MLNRFQVQILWRILLDMYLLYFLFICRVFEHARVQCSKEISSLADISKTLIAPINSNICGAFFEAINVNFESPLGEMIGFETTVKGNTEEELSREVATSIPGGVSSKRFKNKLNLIVKAGGSRKYEDGIYQRYGNYNYMNVCYLSQLFNLNCHLFCK